jgi:plastocyanin
VLKVLGNKPWLFLAMMLIMLALVPTSLAAPSAGVIDVDATSAILPALAKTVHDNGAPWGAVLYYRVPRHENVPSDVAAGQIGGDDFSLSQPTTISELTWFGLYGTEYGDPLDLFQGGSFLDARPGGTSEGFQDNFTIAIYQIDSSGVPSSTPLKTWKVGDVPEEPWFTYASGFYPADDPYVRAGYFRYRAHIPFGDRITLNAGDYLLTIYNDNPQACVYVVGRECTVVPGIAQPQAWEWADSINTDTSFYANPASYKSTPPSGGQVNWQAVPDRELSWILSDHAATGVVEPYTYFDRWSNPYRVDYEPIDGKLYDLDFVCSTSGEIFTKQPWTKMAFYQDPDGAADASLAINDHLTQNWPTSGLEVTTVSYIRYRRYCGNGGATWSTSSAGKYFVPFEQPVVLTGIGWENVDPFICQDHTGERRWCHISLSGIDVFDNPALAETDTTLGDPTFAYLKESRFVPDQPGKINVDKVTHPGGESQSFPFALTGGPDSVNQTFSLTDAGTPHDSGDLKAGTYSVAETVPAGWELTGAICDDGSPPGAIAVAPGETVTCTFTNTKEDTIVIGKLTVPSGGAGFGFTDNIVSPNSFTLDDGGAEVFTEVTPDQTYTITEDDPTGAGYDLIGIACEGSYSGLSIDLDQRSVSFDMGAGETAFCLFVNAERGRVVVDKVTQPGSDPQEFDFELSGGLDDIRQTFSLADVDAPHESELKAGTYALTETVPSGWYLSGSTCDDGSDRHTIHLNPGETITCTFENAQAGTIVVDKHTRPVGMSQEFQFGLSGGPDALDRSFSLTDAAPPYDSGHLKPGTYSVRESEPNGWYLGYATCDDGSDPAAIDLGPGDTVTCDFHNKRGGRLFLPLYIFEY